MPRPRPGPGRINADTCRRFGRSRSQTRSFVLHYGDHLVTAQFDEWYGSAEWTVDGRRARRGATGVELVRDRRDHLEMAAYLRDSGVVGALLELVQDRPFPALLTPVARLGVGFSPEVLRAVDHAARVGPFSASATSGTDDDSSEGSCHEDFWCAPEYRTCGDCSRTTIVFDPPDPPGGGGITPGDPVRCERKYREEVRDCRVDLGACRDREPEPPFDDVGDPVPPRDPGDDPFGHVPLEEADLLVAATDVDRCFRQYEICLDQAMWRFGRCLQGVD